MTSPNRAEPDRTEPTQADRARQILMNVSLLVASSGFLLLGAYCLSQGTLTGFSSGAILALSSFALATLAGFIFGLPRYSQVVAVVPTEKPPDGRPDPPQHAGNGALVRNSRLTSSNNLEQIADWLTKLLLGAGLVQLGTIKTSLGQFINTVAQSLSTADALNPTAAARVVAGCLLGIYISLGFLFGFVATTLWFRRRLNEIDNEGSAT